MTMLKIASCLFGNTRDTSVMHEKTKIVCFIYLQPQKMKFTYGQIHMKQVSNFMVIRSINSKESF